MCNQQPIELSILTAFIDFLRNYQCLSEETIGMRKLFVKPFLLNIGAIDKQSTLRLMSASAIHNYIITTIQPLHRASKKHLISSIRSFLRFAHIKGYLIRDLIEAVPVIKTWKLDRLPQGMSWDDAQKLLTMPDKNISSGRRDLAVLSLLVHYGVRIGQVTALKLQDIHWQNETISFAACKHSNSLQLPLHKNVA